MNRTLSQFAQKSGSPRLDNKRSLAAPGSLKIGASWSGGAVVMHFSKRRLRDRRLPSRHSQETVSSESEFALRFRANGANCNAAIALPSERSRTFRSQLPARSPADGL